MDKSTVPSLQHPLKVALMCNGHYVKHWQAQCIKELMTLDFVRLELILSNQGARNQGQGLRFRRFFSRNFFYRMYSKWVSPSSYRNVHISSLFPSTKTVAIYPVRKGRYSDYFAEEDLDLVRAYQPDFILRFGFHILKGDILRIPKYGIWSYHHSDEQLIRGGPACFWEIHKNHEATGAILQRLTEKIDGGVLLKKGYFKTVRHAFHEQIDQVMYGSVSWVRQVCLDLQNGTADYLEHDAVTTTAAMKKNPSLPTLIAFILGQFRNRLRFHFNALFYTEYWKIGWVDRPISSFIDQEKIENVNWFPEALPPTYHADPFGVEINEKNYLFFERYSYRNGCAELVAQELDEQMKVVNSKNILSGSQHFSYPFVLNYESQTYLLPEHHEQQQTVLYRWDTDKFALEKEAVLLEVGAIDPSLCYFNDRWWLFCTHKTQGSNRCLYLYHAASLTGPYIPHGNNPVKTDVKSARPGGTPFVHEGKLYRPAQNSAKTYGSSVVLHEIHRLSEVEFEEKKVQDILPPADHNYKGLHTLSSWGNRTLIDVKYNRFDVFRFFRRLQRKRVKR
jgi:hypothetical protein